MNRILTLMLLMLLPICMHARFFIPATAGFADSISTEPVTMEMTQDDKGITVTFTFNTISLSEAIDGKFLVDIDGFDQTLTPGMPQLPVKTDTHFVYDTCDVSLKILNASYTDIDGMVSQSAISSRYSDTVKQIDTISQLSVFRSPVYLNGFTQYRRLKMARVCVCPVQYDSENNRIRIYSTISYRLDCRISLQGDNKSKLLRTHRPVLPDDSYRCDNGYMIITESRYTEGLKKFVDWKRKLGFNVIVYDRGRWTSEDIKNTVTYYYQRDTTLKYLLLVGNNENVPAKYVNKVNLEYENDSLKAHYTDLYYGIMDGDSDLFPDIHRGRFDIYDETELSTVIDKVIEYEQNPPQDEAFYQSAAHCSYYEVEKYKNQNAPSTIMEHGHFMKGSEDVLNYLKNFHNKSVDRYYWHFNDTIHESDECMWSKNYATGDLLVPRDVVYAMTTGSKKFSDFANAISQGRFYSLYRGHGRVECLDSKHSYVPFFDFNMINSLSNLDRQTIFFSITCSSGTFDQDCFASRLFTHDNGGAVGVIAATREGYMGYDDALTTGIFNTIWPTPGFTSIKKLDYTNPLAVPKFRLGEILDFAMYNSMSNYYGESLKKSIYTSEIFHCFGDPSMMMRTEAPAGMSLPTWEIEDGIIKVTACEPQYFAFYNHFTQQSDLYHGTSVWYSTESFEDISLLTYKHNEIPQVILTPQYISNPTADKRENRITHLIPAVDGGLRIGYTTASNIESVNIIIVNLDTNTVYRTLKCSGGQNQEVQYRLTPPGMYAVSLSIGSSLPIDTRKVKILK
ncbi:MAG: C25 family cysteine peptidase [Muribaculaceae bacterium]|nr:C25 family cysteine peptidase [Muribaculaceae bacterium]